MPENVSTVSPFSSCSALETGQGVGLRQGTLCILPFALIIMAIAWVAHFWLSDSFGIYSDEVATVMPYMDGRNIGYIFEAFDSFNPFRIGRPLSFLIPALFTKISMKLGGLPTLYLFGYLMFICNVLVLFFILIRTFDMRIAFPAALVFCLFPADLNKAYLGHGLILYPSMLFCLVAIYSYVSGWRIFSYLFVIPCLFCYESAVLPFFAAPLLKNGNESISRKEVAIHCGIIFSLVVVVFVLRAVSGDPRIGGEHYLPLSGNAAPFLAAFRSLRGMILGPLTAMKSFVYAWLHVLRSIDLQVAGAVFAGTVLIGLGFRLLTLFQNPWNGKEVGKPIDLIHLPGHFKCICFSFDKNIFKALWIGLLMLPIGYLFSFNLWQGLLWGRGTRVHFAATFGTAIFGGAVVAFLYSTFRSIGRHVLGTIILAFSISILVGYGFWVQQDYVRNWDHKQWFWRQVLDLCPDVTENSRIFVIDRGLPETVALNSIKGWDTRVYFELLYAFPKHWKTPPRVFIMSEDWTGKLKLKRDEYYWKVPSGNWPSHWEPVPFSNLIVLKMMNGELMRWDGPLLIDGREFPLKPLSSATLNYPTKTLYRYLIE